MKVFVFFNRKEKERGESEKKKSPIAPFLSHLFLLFSTPHQGASQLSHFRFVPGAGGLSLKSLPSESRTPADQNEGLEEASWPPPRARTVRAAESAALRRRDIFDLIWMLWDCETCLL